jgi:protein transport protein SEC23
MVRPRSCAGGVRVPASPDCGLVMVQPSLVSYSLGSPRSAVQLDSSSVQPDCALLLDTFFDVVIYYGQKIVEWRNARYHEMPEHAHLASLLNSVKDDSVVVSAGRLPASRIVEADANSSEARLLKYRVNPPARAPTERDVASKNVRGCRCGACTCTRVCV